jgi:hypothetical protein
MAVSDSDESVRRLARKARKEAKGAKGAKGAKDSASAAGVTAGLSAMLGGDVAACMCMATSHSSVLWLSRPQWEHFTRAGLLLRDFRARAMVLRDDRDADAAECDEEDEDEDEDEDVVGAVLIVDR